MYNTEKKIFILVFFIILSLFVIMYLNPSKVNDTNDFKVYFFNAGKADAILISKNNRYIMIDTGEESLSNEILTYFKNNNITKLDYLIITHFDKDHVGSASNIIDNIEIENVLQSNYPKESTYYNNYLNSLESKNITPITVNGDFNIDLDGIEIVVNGPSMVFNNNESNNSSLIVKVTYNNNKFLFMGDAENDRISDFLENNNETFDFLKVPYHGHYLLKLDELLEKINVKYAVITSSNEEMESKKTTELLDENNINYYLTREGSITILSDGDNITVRQ